MIEELIADENVLNIYNYGSRVYKTNSEKSDYDYIIVVKKVNYSQLNDNNINISFYSVDNFNDKLINHDIDALECFYLKDVVKESIKFDFKLDLRKLRKSISSKASNSYVKAKKKLTLEKDYNEYIGKKSLFHSLRILSFGIQISKFNNIEDYSSMNYLYNDIVNSLDDWNTLNSKYKKIYNSLSTEFRLLAPK